MAHLYDKAPPAFAKDPIAWDYTRDRMEGNSGLPYDQWEGKHFAGAAAMYKNVVKKYGVSMGQGNVTRVPQECINCGGTNPFYVDDYVCKVCRDAIESADTYAEAEAITQPEAIEDIRKQLYESLGHAKKDAKLGKDMLAPVENQMAPQVVTPSDVIMDVEPVASVKVSRNYKAMNDDKLRRSIDELDRGEGEAVRKIKPGESIMDHYEAALRAAQEKGI